MPIWINVARNFAGNKRSRLVSTKMVGVVMVSILNPSYYAFPSLHCSLNPSVLKIAIHSLQTVFSMCTFQLARPVPATQSNPRPKYPVIAFQASFPITPSVPSPAVHLLSHSLSTNTQTAVPSVPLATSPALTKPHVSSAKIPVLAIPPRKSSHSSCRTESTLKCSTAPLAQKAFTHPRI